MTYSLEKEVLCLLPMFPRMASVESMARDLGVTQTAIRSAVGRLCQAHSIAVGIEDTHPRGNNFSLPESSWRRSHWIGQQYWAQRYGAVDDRYGFWWRVVHRRLCAKDVNSVARDVGIRRLHGAPVG